MFDLCLYVKFLVLIFLLLLRLCSLSWEVAQWIPSCFMRSFSDICCDRNEWSFRSITPIAISKKARSKMTITINWCILSQIILQRYTFLLISRTQNEIFLFFTPKNTFFLNYYTRALVYVIFYLYLCTIYVYMHRLTTHDCTFIRY